MVGDEHFPHHKKLIDGLCEASKVINDSSFPIYWKIPAVNKVVYKSLFYITLQSLRNISGIVRNCPMSFQNLRKQFFRVFCHLWIFSEVVFGKYKKSLDDLCSLLNALRNRLQLMVRNKLCWDTSYTVRLSKQRKGWLVWFEFLCFGSSTVHV